MTEQSERWGVLACRLNASHLGGATAWCWGRDRDGRKRPLLFASHAEAIKRAEDYNARTVSPNVSYVAARYS
jgi:hypothetical protein